LVGFRSSIHPIRVTYFLSHFQQIAKPSHKQAPWWLKIAGSFEEDSTFDEVVKLGQEWRKSAE
jgi:hypothetical protein